MKKLYKSLLIVLAAFSITSCTKDFLDVNDNPNNPSDASVELLLPYAQVTTAYHVGGDLNIASSMFAQHIAAFDVQYINIDRYYSSESTGYDSWNDLYKDALRDYQRIIEKSKTDAKVPGELDNYAGIATIMKAYTYGVLTSLYGDIPFEESIQGKDNLSPRPQAQAEVFAGIQTLLSEGIKIIEEAPESALIPEDVDLVYGGDMQKWLLFANSLKLRYYMRISKQNPTEAQQGIQAVLNSPIGVFDVASEKASLTFGKSDLNKNPLAYPVSYFIRPSHTIVDILTSYSPGPTFPDADVRMFAYFAYNGEYPLGQANGVGGKVDNISSLANNFIGNNAPVSFMDAAEIYFIRAEAAARGYTTEDDSLLYAQGVETSIRKFYPTIEQFNQHYLAYHISKPGIAYPESGTLEEKLDKIITQKWISLFGNGVEAFSEIRRFDFSIPTGLAPAEKSVLPVGAFPQRLIYPMEEVSTNKNIEVIPLDEKVWFAK